jgi:hypothetical protein
MPGILNFVFLSACKGCVEMDVASTESIDEAAKVKADAADAKAIAAAQVPIIAELRAEMARMQEALERQNRS